LCHRGLHDCDGLSAPYKINRDGVIIASPPATYPNRCTRQAPCEAGSGAASDPLVLPPGGSGRAPAQRPGQARAAAGVWRGGDRWPLGSKTGSKRAAISGHHQRRGATETAGRATCSHI
jgi:hypothetical protein